MRQAKGVHLAGARHNPLRPVGIELSARSQFLRSPPELCRRSDPKTPKQWGTRLTTQIQKQTSNERAIV